MNFAQILAADPNMADADIEDFTSFMTGTRTSSGARCAKPAPPARPRGPREGTQPPSP
jgi:hypothetical protein